MNSSRTSGHPVGMASYDTPLSHDSSPHTVSRHWQERGRRTCVSCALYRDRRWLSMSSSCSMQPSFRQQRMPFSRIFARPYPFQQTSSPCRQMPEGDWYSSGYGTSHQTHRRSNNRSNHSILCSCHEQLSHLARRTRSLNSLVRRIPGYFQCKVSSRCPRIPAMV